MNLKPMFEQQKKTMAMYEEKHPTKPGEDRFNKKILALMVEVSECANEWRGFKYWKENPQPTDNLLEEYVDGLHFILEIGIELGVSSELHWFGFNISDITDNFIYINYEIAMINPSFKNDKKRCIHHYRNLLQLYLGLGNNLGFTFGLIEQAYFDKNKINYERQEEGY